MSQPRRPTRTCAPWPSARPNSPMNVLWGPAAAHPTLMSSPRPLSHRTSSSGTRNLWNPRASWADPAPIQRGPQDSRGTLRPLARWTPPHFSRRLQRTRRPNSGMCEALPPCKPSPAIRTGSRTWTSIPRGSTSARLPSTIPGVSGTLRPGRRSSSRMGTSVRSRPSSFRRMAHWLRPGTSRALATSGTSGQARRYSPWWGM
mmetsp:Transcript_2264/g.6560  ORF Transcript_2264/g.6560 Transcript_2264/m.6560 type:complete len:202 (+) Transcript_2264:550-1155(+)